MIATVSRRPGTRPLPGLHPYRLPTLEPAAPPCVRRTSSTAKSVSRPIRHRHAHWCREWQQVLRRLPKRGRRGPGSRSRQPLPRSLASRRARRQGRPLQGGLSPFAEAAGRLSVSEVLPMQTHVSKFMLCRCLLHAGVCLMIYRSASSGGRPSPQAHNRAPASLRHPAPHPSSPRPPTGHSGTPAPVLSSQNRGMASTLSLPPGMLTPPLPLHILCR